MSRKRERGRSKGSDAERTYGQIIAALEKTSKGWDAAKRLYNYPKVGETLEGAAGNADVKHAIALFFLAGLLTFAFSMISVLELMQLSNLASDAIYGTGEMPQQYAPPANLAPLAGFMFVFYVIFGVVLNVAHEAAAFTIIKATGGKGSFDTHVYLSSLAALSLGMGAVLNLIAPLPCFQLIAAIGLVLLTAYVVLFVSTKAYSVAHRISHLHALGVVLLLLLPRLLLLFIALNWIAGFFGFPIQIEIPVGTPGGG